MDWWTSFIAFNLSYKCIILVVDDEEKSRCKFCEIEASVIQPISPQVTCDGIDARSHEANELSCWMNFAHGIFRIAAPVSSWTKWATFMPSGWFSRLIRSLVISRIGNSLLLQAELPSCSQKLTRFLPSIKTQQMKSTAEIQFNLALIACYNLQISEKEMNKDEENGIESEWSIY